MSENKEQEAKSKKKSKLPVIIAIVAILGGGGFFMMKGKGKKEEKPAITLGAIETVEPEFLVNLSNGTTYLRTQVALQFQEGFKKEDLDKNMPAVQDVITSILSSKSPSSIRTLEGKKKLKAEIASKVNALLATEKHEEDPADSKDKKKKKDKEEEHEGEPDWDSGSGPCLKIFFISFVMQST
ncbi:MAG TPA: flagellar basal body-associated FliL family protein [Fimbriimonadaceae bacterium]|nr:flagellar basal body-associated FliL family protein [Fimbriimonadaceae bacterium]